MAKTGHPNITLRYSAPWRGTTKIWSSTFNYSGATLSTDQQLAFAQAVHNDVLTAFFSAGATSQYLSSWSSYDGQNSAALQEAEYGSAAESITAGWNGVADYGAAYTASGTNVGVSGLETCVVLLAPLGLNKTGKPYFLRKFIHGVPPMSGDSDNAPFVEGADAIAAKLGDGSLPGNRVICAETGGQGTWSAQSYFGNHKLFRAYSKKKSNASVFQTISEILQDGGAITSIAELVP